MEDVRNDDTVGLPDEDNGDDEQQSRVPDGDVVVVGFGVVVGAGLWVGRFEGTREVNDAWDAVDGGL